MTPPTFLGELCAALAPMCWAGAVILYRQTELPPAGMNLFKNGIAVVLLTVTLLVFGVSVPGDRPIGDWLTLVGSGLLGLAIADTLLLEGLRRIGAARLALVDTTYTPMMVLMAWAILGERPGIGFALGAGLVVFGVAVATVDLRQAIASGDRSVALGGLMAFLAVLGSGASVIWVKPVLETSDLIEITWVRLLAGVLGQVAWTTLRGEWGEVGMALRPSTQWRYLVPAAVLGTYLSLLLWLGGFKWADASVAAVLNQLATVYIVAMAWAVLGESVGRKQVAGAVLAVAGAVVVMVA